MKIKNTSQLKELPPVTNFEKNGSRAKKRSKIGSIRIVKILLALKNLYLNENIMAKFTPVFERLM